MHFASTVLMIKPTSFGFNIETSKDNVFQKQNNRLSNQQIQLEAEKESRLLRDKLIDSNINWQLRVRPLLSITRFFLKINKTEIELNN